MEPAGLPLRVAFLRDPEQQLGGWKAAEPAAKAAFDPARVARRTFLQRGMRLVQLGAQALARQFDHGRRYRGRTP